MTSSVNGACPLNLNPPATEIVAGELQYKRMVGSDANLDEITEYGTYIVQAGHRVFINGCILYVFKIERYIHHIAFDITGSYILTRFKGYSGYWYKWMKINLYIYQRSGRNTISRRV